MAWSRQDRRHALHRHPPLPRLRRRVRRDGRSSASSPTTRARPSARCSPSASRSPPRCSGCSSPARARRRAARARRAATSRSPLALGAIGYSAQAGALLRGARRGSTPSLLSLLVYTFPVIVTVAAIALGRERASRRTAVALALASAGLVLVARRAPARARWTRSAPRSGSRAAVVYSAYILDLGGRRRAARPARAQHARLHRRGGDADARRPRRRRAATRAA